MRGVLAELGLLGTLTPEGLLGYFVLAAGIMLAFRFVKWAVGQLRGQ